MRIAVIGGGISGLTAAYLLSRKHQVTLFEASNRIGGHAYTVSVPSENGPVSIDMGFIVFNREKYPNFVRLLGELGVDSQPSEMSFSVRSETSGLEYRTTSLNTLFAQRRNLLSPSFHRMILDIARFNRRSRELLQNGNHSTTTLEQYVTEGGYSRRFWEDFLAPMGSAIWSAAPENTSRFPATYFARFFANHGFLEPNGGYLWRTIRGGSQSYLRRIVLPFFDRIRLNAPVREIRRFSDRVTVATESGTSAFDHVVIAAHSDQALAMLKDPTESEKDVLGAIRYQPNDTLLHTDDRLLPRNRRAWASWNYVVPARPQASPHVTYYSNRLQSLGDGPNYCVSLNQTASVRPDRILDRVEFHHPIYTQAALDAHSRVSEVSGRHRTSYCGAYWGFGFHEDGVNSALEATAPFGVTL
ncbi:MAG TPA: FAD-dependent oxidoreductase [Vicinamibacteria bacterium]|nr:FAD-dependent oxidoreductase [Vicinamibacteria bacterium]